MLYDCDVFREADLACHIMYMYVEFLVSRMEALNTLCNGFFQENKDGTENGESGKQEDSGKHRTRFKLEKVGQVDNDH